MHALRRGYSDDLTILAEWFNGEPLVRLRVDFAAHFAHLLPAYTVEALAQEALAWSGAFAPVPTPSFSRRTSSHAASVAFSRRPSRTRPDPELRAEMKRTLRRLGRA